MNLRFEPFDIEDKPEITGMIKMLYIDDPSGETMNNEKIDRTIEFLQANPGNGQILTFSDDKTIVGYSILANFWSNEFGGIILYIDELFIKAEFRNKKIGSKFIEFLIKANKYTKAIFLDVLPSNKKAYEFYKRNGFSESHGITMKYII